jgi:hypothetical protein
MSRIDGLRLDFVPEFPLASGETYRLILENDRLIFEDIIGI